MTDITTNGVYQEVTPGKLKIFLGYASGVGKTYAMLEAAHRVNDAGTDVVVGYIEPNSQCETAALLDGMEQLPPKEISGNTEFDLDAALQRHPQLLVLDNLAHENCPGCRHLKRYQDVEELLHAGIDVYTTINVQQLESLTDMVEAITGETVIERIPDSVFDSADQVELVDLEPAELLDRLVEGKITTKGLSEKKLAALRELALRRTADRLDRLPGRAGGTAKSKTVEHIMICLSGAPSNAKVIRTAARMADAFHGTFTALFVETPDFNRQSEQARVRFLANTRLAEELGARITTVYGDDPAVQIAEYARISGVTKIVLGRSPNRKTLFSKKTLMDRLNEYAPDLDLYIIPDHNNAAPQPVAAVRIQPERKAVRDIARMLAILALCTVAGFAFQDLGFSQETISMVYILGVLITAISTTGPLYSLLSALSCVFCFNYFFAYPYFSLLSTPDHLATCIVMLVVGVLGSTITTRVKDQATQSADKAYRTEILLETSQKLQKAEDMQAIVEATATQLNRLLDRSLVIYPIDADGNLMKVRLFGLSENGEKLTHTLVAQEFEIAQWVQMNRKQAGATTSTFSDARCLYLAVHGSERVEAVVGILIDLTKELDAFEKNLLIATLDQCGIALEKERMARAKQEAEEAVRQEALRANLLRAISHDLRTPLTSISGNAGILMENGSVLNEEKKKEIYSSIYDDSMWLISLVENLLSITRMENGTMKLNIQPELMEEIFNEALNHLDRNAPKHNIRMELEDDLLMADMDARLIVQVIINLLNNAIKYTHEGSNITLSAKPFAGMVLVKVTDDGPGIPDHAKKKVFDMFYTENNLRGDGRRGLGLGLALCKSIVVAHGGVITVTDNEPNGSCFSFTLKPSEVTALE